MKICPQCRTIYTDDSLQYCLQDGMPLVNSAATDNWTEAETVVSSKETGKARVDLPPQSISGGRETIIAEPPRKSNMTLIVALTVLLTLLAVAAGALGVLYFRANSKREVVQNVNPKPASSVFSNINQNPNVNSALNSNTEQTPTVTPTPKPILNPKEIDEIKFDIKNVVENWNDALLDHDLDEHLNNYAPTVDYYKSSSVGIGKIRADKQRALDFYDDINIKISNLNVTPDETGEKATAVFDKEWNFEGEGRFSSGKVQQQLQLAKIGEKWRITSERDLKTYYTSR